MGSKKRMERTLGHYVNKKISWYKYMNGFSGKPFMAGSWEGEKRETNWGYFLHFPMALSG